MEQQDNEKSVMLSVLAGIGIGVLVGALTLVTGQIIVRGAIEPALELKRLIGTIAHDIDFYANRFLLATAIEQQEWRDRFRKIRSVERHGIVALFCWKAPDGRCEGY